MDKHKNKILLGLAAVIISAALIGGLVGVMAFGLGVIFGFLYVWLPARNYFWVKRPVARKLFGAIAVFALVTAIIMYTDFFITNLAVENFCKELGYKSMTHDYSVLSCYGPSERDTVTVGLWTLDTPISFYTTAFVIIASMASFVVLSLRQIYRKLARSK